MPKPKVKRTVVKKRPKKAKTNGQVYEGYCVKCQEKRPIEAAKRVTMKNDREAMKGVCPECGTGMFRILGKND